MLPRSARYGPISGIEPLRSARAWNQVETIRSAAITVFWEPRREGRGYRAMLPNGLTYYPDTEPGICRLRAGRGFSYRAPDGARITDKDERARLDALAVPPAYTDVWICPHPKGHLQATGRDAAGRKQYLYHPDWTDFRAGRKFADLARFGRALPRLRANIRKGLDEEPGSRAFAIAAVLALIDRLSLRPGHAEYQALHGSVGATTLRSRHLTVADDALSLSFVAKGGTKVETTLTDQKLAKAMAELDDLPGAPLATWVEGDMACTVTPDMLTRHMEEVTGEDGLTPKTFRTWNGSAAAMEVAINAKDRVTITEMAEAAAARLHNTPSIARNSYIHPEVIALTNASAEARTKLATAETPTALRKAERALLALIR